MIVLWFLLCWRAKWAFRERSFFHTHMHKHTHTPPGKQTIKQHCTYANGLVISAVVRSFLSLTLSRCRENWGWDLTDSTTAIWKVTRFTARCLNISKLQCGDFSCEWERCLEPGKTSISNFNFKDKFVLQRLLILHYFTPTEIRKMLMIERVKFTKFWGGSRWWTSKF